MAGILVISNDKATCMVFEHILIWAGHTVFLINDSHKGIDAFNTHRPDLVITDIDVPGTGEDVIREIRQVCPKVTIIAMVAGEELILIQARDAGATHVIPKPFDTVELFSLVKSCLDDVA